MGHAHAADQKIENPGSLKASSILNGLFGLMAIIGAIAFMTTLLANPSKAWTSFLTGHFFFMGISMGALFFVVIQWITSSMWSAPMLRIAESFTAYLPVVLLTTVILCLFGLPHIYEWMDPSRVEESLIISGKSGYLNKTFFVIRSLLAVVIWIFFARKIVGSSLKVDQGQLSYVPTFESNRKWGVAFLAFFAISFSMSAFDQLMSIDAEWFSTMFGVYAFAGIYQSFFATLAIVVIFMRRAGYLKQVINENHLHDIAKMMFAFTVFWAYTGFSQYMLIWYANLPEETGYFLLRFNPGWEKISIALFMGKFVFPFLALLPRGNKRNESLVLCVAFWILGMQFLDLVWIIQPKFAVAGPAVGFAELGTWIGFLGVFGLLVTRFLSKNPVVAMKNPYLPESVFHHHV